MRTRSGVRCDFLLGLAMTFAMGMSKMEVKAEEENVNPQINEGQIVENNSRVIFYDTQGNTITSANPGDTVYVEFQDASIDVSNIPQANGSGMKRWWIEPTELLNKGYTFQPIFGDLDGDRYPSWHDGSMRDYLK